MNEYDPMMIAGIRIRVKKLLGPDWEDRCNVYDIAQILTDQGHNDLGELAPEVADELIIRHSLPPFEDEEDEEPIGHYQAWNSNDTMKLPTFALIVRANGDHIITADQRMLMRFDSPPHALGTLQLLAEFDGHMLDEEILKDGQDPGEGFDREVWGAGMETYANSTDVAMKMIMMAADHARTPGERTWWTWGNGAEF